MFIKIKYLLFLIFLTSSSLIFSENYWEKQLIKASEEGNVNQVKRILSDHKFKDLSNNLQWSIIYKASEKGQLEIIKIFYNEAPQESYKGHTKLQIIEESSKVSISYGNLNIIKYFIDNNLIDIKNNNIDNNKSTFLLLALNREKNSGNFEMSEYLLNAGVDINFVDRYYHLNGKTALMIASEIGAINIVKLLLEKGANPDVLSDKWMTALDYAKLKKNNEEIIDLLKNYGKNYGKNDEIVEAIKNGNTNFVKTKVQNGLNINTKIKCSIDNWISNIESEYTLLNLAVNYEKIDIVNYLLNNKADVNIAETKYQMAPLHHAVRLGNYKIVELLVSFGSNINQEAFDKNTPIFFICNAIGKLDENKENIDKIYKIVKLLSSKKADLNYSNKNGYTTLSWFLLNSENLTTISSILDIFIDNGCDINFASPNSTLLIHLIKKNSNKDKLIINKIKLLLAKGAKINQYSYGTALTEAVNENNIDIVKFLVSKGADVNSTDSCDRSSLIIAIERNNLDMVKFLISNKANIYFKDISKKDCLMIALEKKNKEIINLFLNKNIDINYTDKNGKSLIKYVLDYCSITKDYDILNSFNINKDDINKNSTFVNEKNPNLLLYSIFLKDLYLVKYMVKKGAYINFVIKTITGEEVIGGSLVKVQTGPSSSRSEYKEKKRKFKIEFTVLNYAYLCGNKEIADYLKSIGAEVGKKE